jgi:hypothetical protein
MQEYQYAYSEKQRELDFKLRKLSYQALDRQARRGGQGVWRLVALHVSFRTAGRDGRRITPRSPSSILASG